MADNNPVPATTTSETNSGDNLPLIAFGDFRTQTCGAWSMALLAAQGELTKMGAELAISFTKGQKESYVGQSTFLSNALDSSYKSADKQAEQMHLAAAGEIASGVIGIVGFATPLAIRSGVVPESLRGKFCKTTDRLNNTTDKLHQQEKLLQEAHSISSKPVKANVGGNTPSTQPTSAEEEFARARKEELLTTGGSKARELDTTNLSTQNKSGSNAKASELGTFNQTRYDSKGNYYRDGSTVTDEEVSNGTKTKGAYHFKDLDKAAIEQMTPAEKKTFIERLEKNIQSTHQEINTLTTRQQMWQSSVEQCTSMVKNLSSGGFQGAQATPTKEMKKNEADATIANNDSNLASSVAQSDASSRDSAINNAMSALREFSGVYQAARG